MFNDNELLTKELARISEEHFGQKDVKIEIVQTMRGRGAKDVYISETMEIDHTRPMNPAKIMEDYMKIKSYRVANSSFFKEQNKEKDEMIIELKRKVDRIEEMLYNTLCTDENKLSEL